MNRDELIALARSLYNGGKGISYGKIAEKFNADGVATLSGKGSWDKRTIQRLVSADALKKAEVKVGMKTDREVQLESEVEFLKSQLNEVKIDFDKMLGHLAITEESLSVVNGVNKRNNEEFETAINYFRSENERLESEIESLKSEQTQMIDVISMLRKQHAALESENAELARKNQYLTERLADSAGHVNGNLKVIADLTVDNDRLREAIDELNKVKQENVEKQKEIEGLVVKFRGSMDKLYNKNGELSTELKASRERVAGFDAENQRLHRMLNEAELRFKTLYESEIARLGSELAISNERIQELQDKQTFLKPESETGMPKNYFGWTVQKRHDGRGINLYRKFSGKLKALYVGKEWNVEDARYKIEAFELKNKPQSELFGTECKSCQHQPAFESRLRSVCPETVRTYRLDTVAGHFPDCVFGSEMIALAEQKRIELLAGDPSQCDVSKLISYRGRMYVNFEWR